MSISLKLFTSLLVASMLVAVTQSAFAAPATITTEQIVDEIVNWALSPAQCPSLQVPLAGTGTRHEVIITKTYPDGSSQNITNDLVKGTAADSTGTYHFIYTNHNIITTPSSGSPIQVEMTDSFVVNGNGSAKHLDVGFHWRWTYTPPAGIFETFDNWQQFSTRGDPLKCDPI